MSDKKIQYFILMAHWTATPLFFDDEDRGVVDFDEIGLPLLLQKGLVSWNERYKEIIPLGIDERKALKYLQLVAVLDKEGIAFCDQMRSLFPWLRVRYFSEGQLRFLET